MLAIGSALTVLGFLVVKRQNEASAAAGDRGQPGSEATPSKEGEPVWLSSSKSLTGPVVATRKLTNEPSQTAYTEVDGFINYGEPIKTTGVNALDESETVILGTKSAAVVRPLDIANARIDKSAREEVTRLLGRALGFYDLGNYLDAASEYSRALATDPNNTTAQAGLERCRTAMNTPVQPKQYFPGSKSAPMVSPADVNRLRQSNGQQSPNSPAQQTNQTRQQ